MEDVVELTGQKNREVKSISYDESTFIHLVNGTNVTIKTYWLNYNGTRVPYTTLAPGETYKQQTFVTHPWIAVEKETDSPVGLCFQPLAKPGKAVFRFINPSLKDLCKNFVEQHHLL